MARAKGMADIFSHKPGDEPPKVKTRQRRGGWSWGPVEEARLRVMNNGVGVQSTTLIMMMCVGELPWVDHILHAEVGDESALTYQHLEWLDSQITRYSNGRVGIHKVSRGGRLSDRIRNRHSGSGAVKQDRFVTIPAFVATAKGGQGRRQCTRDFKIEPLVSQQRRLLGYKPRQRIPAKSCESWIGFSTDEVVRAGAAFDAWVVHRFPLLERGMSRLDCERWLVANGFPVPPKSACVFCPYKTNAEWRWLKQNDPQGWSDAVEIDRLMRDTPGMRHQEFLHRSLKPLDEVDLRTDEEAGQGMLMVCDAGCGL